ncbi:MAG: DUF47 family protein [Spirochaetaceae bacterium]|nr:MAG: DUF47 family protein [Spirochaetaceae bacterium]
MPLFIWKRERIILEKIQIYLGHISACQYYCLACLLRFMNQDVFDSQDSLVQEVHREESKADDLRREIEEELYHKALVPDLREDILYLMEAMDALPNTFEHICFHMSHIRIIIPVVLRKDIEVLLSRNLETSKLICQAFHDFFYRRDIVPLIRRIDSFESEIDKIEHSLTSRIFELPVEKADMILLNQLVRDISSVSDKAEAISDRLGIAVAKRRL